MKIIFGFTVAIFIIGILAIVAVCVINLCKKINWKKEAKSALTKTLNIIITVCLTFVVTSSFTLFFQCESNQNIKSNEPLILESKPIFSNEGNVSKLKLRAKQGTVVKGLVVIFNKDKVSYSPIHFNGNNDLVSDDFKISSKNTEINMENTSPKGRKPEIDANKKIIVSQGHLVQLGIILKDSKENIYSYYYLIRPSVSCKSGMSLGLSVSDNSDTYFYDQKCNNYSKAKILVSGAIIGKDSKNYDLSNIENQIENNSAQISKYKFHLVKSNDRTINASRFKTSNGKKTLQDDAKPGSIGKITSDPITTLSYNPPKKKEVKQNIKVLDDIIKDF